MLLQDGFVHRAGDSNRVTKINFVLDGCKTLNGRLRRLEMRERLDARTGLTRDVFALEWGRFLEIQYVRHENAREY
jgi:hypothetical protein